VRLGVKLPMRWSADQVSLNIEGVVDGGMETKQSVELICLPPILLKAQ
jgi:hypothetical protein